MYILKMWAWRLERHCDKKTIMRGGSSLTREIFLNLFQRLRPEILKPSNNTKYSVDFFHYSGYENNIMVVGRRDTQALMKYSVVSNKETVLVMYQRKARP